MIKFEKPVLEVILSETIVTARKENGTVNLAPEHGSGGSWTGSCCYKD